MKIAILGYGSQGESAYKYWSKDDNEITICDSRTDLDLPAKAGKQLGDKYLENLEVFDLLIRTPIIHPKQIVEANSDYPEILSKVSSNTNEFFRVCPTKNIIGVTGTKGKGTTSTLIARMLEADGKRVHLGGNIGIPPLELLENNIQSDDWVVLELANFQLIDLKYSPHIAVCLMVVPEHMDWHEDFEEYVAAKQQLFINQEDEDIAIYYAANENSESIACASMGELLPYMETPGAYVENNNIVIENETVCAVNEIGLLGKHNWQNVCAAVTTVWQITKNIEAMKSVITSFSGIEHRLELVRELDSIKYYDDSFGTTPETAIVAIEAFEQPKVIILGGSDKGSNYETLAATIKASNVRKVLLIGDMADTIKSALDGVGLNNYQTGGSTMEEIVSNARSEALAGDVILLSTGCASFGMFDNYKDRGEQFKKAVQSLA